MMIQFFKFPLLFSGGIQLNLDPTSTVCFVWKMTLNKKSFRCTRCDLRVHNKCNNTVFFDSDIRSDCRWENLPYHVSFCTDNSNDRKSSLLDNLPSILSHNEACRVFRYKGIHFGHLNFGHVTYFPKLMN